MATNENECIVKNLYMNEGSVESIRYFECRKTLMEMLRDRWYNVCQSEITLSLNEYRQRFGAVPKPETLGVCVSLTSNPSNKVQVVFTGTEYIRKKTMTDIYSQIVDKERLSRLILIVQSNMTAFARKELEKCPYKVEIIKLNDLVVNVTKHVLQPKFEVLTADEKQELLKKYKIGEKQLPHMLRTDAIASYFGLERGQVLKISHSGEMFNSLVTYRYVV
ncbi:DNA-directed RNA polymerase V subunit 5C-like isoform X1 [Cicer arietinum]|uniref:DNA-directed RNA polymerase V subunit 5C-like isoform X1 n=1 Tax=Cicer arietinum TaxID=3827 RepID=A0A1S2Z758_CICAR|nr:DNA-directed RNA polymerase V subunit 5C-like isoform X1 [Cicer arietinum]